MLRDLLEVAFFLGLSVDFAKHKEKLGPLLTKWENVEEAIKSAELLQGRVTVPAINELRYAGRQLIRAISLENEQQAEFERALVVADQYLVNADHDVTDAVISFIGRRVDELNFRYGRKAICARISTYQDLYNAVNECRKLIKQARHSANERNSLYDTIKDKHFNKIIELNEAMVSTDTQMALELAGYENEAREKEKGFIIAFSIMTITIIALTILLYFKW